MTFVVPRNHNSTVLCAVLFLWVGFISACHSNKTPTFDGQQRFAMTGRVVAANLEYKKVTIAHDNIPGYMEPMTMAFTLQDDATLQTLKRGDQVRATLVVDPRTNLTWLEKFEVTATSPTGELAAKQTGHSSH
jgi:protein SCO1/2